MTTRNVLLVTPYFAPQSHAAVFRVHKLAKYLPRYGWKPYVLTTDVNYLYNEDPELLQDLHDEVEISRARYVEPTLRGLRMALGGRDRSFAARRAAGEFRARTETADRAILAMQPRRLYDYLLTRWLQVPDPYWTWYRPALREGLRLVRKHRIKVVYTTFLPYTCNQIGRALQRFGCRWVADFRDPGTYSKRMSSRHHHVYLRQREIERETLRSADRVTCLSSSYPLIFNDIYGVFRNNAMRFIPTGADAELFPDAAGQRPYSYPYLLFCGEYLEEYGCEFLELFSETLKESDVSDNNVRLVVAGHEVVNRRRMLPLIRRLKMEKYVTFVDHMCQRELYGLIYHAHSCLLIPGATSHWWSNFAKMVDFIAMRKPVLAIVPDPSEARKSLQKSRLGVLMDGTRDQRLDTLRSHLCAGPDRLNPREEYCNNYLAARQARDFSRVFEELIRK